MSKKLYVVIPAYNEEENIAAVARSWHEVLKQTLERGDIEDGRLVIANDGSKDKTLSTLNSLMRELPLLEVLDKPNSGHGATVQYLYRHALGHNADYIFQTDSDGQTLADEFHAFWQHRDSHDFIIGTRRSRQDGWSRRFVTRVLRLVVRVCFGVDVADANTPFRLMNAASLKTVLEHVPEDFFLCNVAVSAVAVKKRYKVLWLPITFRTRQGGKNSINFRRITKIGFRAVGDFRKINKSIQ